MIEHNENLIVALENCIEHIEGVTGCALRPLSDSAEVCALARAAIAGEKIESTRGKKPTLEERAMHVTLQLILSLFKFRFPPDFPGGKFTVDARNIVFEAALVEDKGSYWTLTKAGEHLISRCKERSIFAQIRNPIPPRSP